MAGQLSQMDGVGRGGCGRRWAGQLWTPWLSSGPQGRQGEEPSGSSPCEPLSHHSWASLPPEQCIPGVAQPGLCSLLSSEQWSDQGHQQVRWDSGVGDIVGDGLAQGTPALWLEGQVGSKPSPGGWSLWASPLLPREPHLHGLYLALGDPQSKTKTSSRQGRAVPLSLDTHTVASTAETALWLVREAWDSGPLDGASPPWSDVQVPGCWARKDGQARH